MDLHNIVRSESGGGLPELNELSEKRPKIRWNFRPDLSDQFAPYFRWPPNVGGSLRYLVGSGSFLGARVYVLGIAMLSWYFFAPELERCQEFSADWIAQIWLRNIIIMLLPSHPLHALFIIGSTTVIMAPSRRPGINGLTLTTMVAPMVTAG